MALNQNKIDKGNRLIVKFMKYFADDEAVVIRMHGYAYDQLKFHTSFDWLMPVVEQIEALNTSPEEKDGMTNWTKFYTVTIYGNICRIGSVAGYASSVCVCEGKGESKIEAVWNAVVNFIKWYNKQNN